MSQDYKVKDTKKQIIDFSYMGDSNIETTYKWIFNGQNWELKKVGEERVYYEFDIVKDPDDKKCIVTKERIKI